MNLVFKILVISFTLLLSGCSSGSSSDETAGSNNKESTGAPSGLISKVNDRLKVYFSKDMIISSEISRVLNGENCSFNIEGEYSILEITCSTDPEQFDKATEKNGLFESMFVYPGPLKDNYNYASCARDMTSEFNSSMVEILKQSFKEINSDKLPNQGFRFTLNYMKSEGKSKVDAYGKVDNSEIKAEIFTKNQFGITSNDFSKIEDSMKFDQTVLNTMSDGSRQPKSWNKCKGYLPYKW